MQLFTITIHSNCFGKDIEDELLEEMAAHFHQEMKRLLKVHGVDSDLSVDTYWRKGSLIAEFLLTLQNVDIASVLTIAGSYKVVKEYKSLRENVVLIAGDIKKFSTKVGGVFVSAKDTHLSEGKPSPKSKKLEDKSDHKP
ncbi:hypothetical protein [Thalassotalea castellviae]|uniref:Uncharacterized protein n=1 Tax=Thalassotalea castellviae TaxID=3075612 RepID=A0ABU2ZWY8_9GAMM|nr:hypothetical protein [Thalassotalea sp. W431]MDT0602190.1 hypothetical protein [Thalassotalea sp. W431]